MHGHASIREGLPTVRIDDTCRIRKSAAADRDKTGSAAETIARDPGNSSVSARICVRRPRTHTCWRRIFANDRYVPIGSATAVAAYGPHGSRHVAFRRECSFRSAGKELPRVGARTPSPALLLADEKGRAAARAFDDRDCP